MSSRMLQKIKKIKKKEKTKKKHNHKWGSLLKSTTSSLTTPFPPLCLFKFRGATANRKDTQQTIGTGLQRLKYHFFYIWSTNQ